MRLRQHYSVAVLVLVFESALIGCGTPGPPLPPSLELPKAVTDLRATRKGERVTLTWTVPQRTTDRGKISHLGPTRICRNLPSVTKCNEVAQVPPIFPAATALGREKKRQATGKAQPQNRVTGTYEDTLPPELSQKGPTVVVNYGVEVMNEDNRSAGLSNLAPIPVARTFAPPSLLEPDVTAEGVQLRWAVVAPGSESPGITYFYRVYRRLEGTKTDTIAGEVPLSGGSQVVFTDHGFEWNKTYQYRVTVVTVLSRPEQSIQIEGNDSPTIQVPAKDVFPPAVPTGLQAVFSGVGQQPFIDLVWVPDTESDLAGYNVYRHEASQAAIKINTEPVKTPAFRDANVSPGKKYFYAVSAVDVRDNESARSEEASEQVP